MFLNATIIIAIVTGLKTSHLLTPNASFCAAASDTRKRQKALVLQVYLVWIQKLAVLQNNKIIHRIFNYSNGITAII